MSKKEINRLEILEKVKTKQMTQSALYRVQRVAAEILKISMRQVKRLAKAYREQGAAGLVSKRWGKPSNNQIAQEVKQKVVDVLSMQCAQDHDSRGTMETEKGEATQKSPTARTTGMFRGTGTDRWITPRLV